jgi:GT2 family glycosyltransferase
MENARGEFFIFIDSDCTVPVHWLTEIDKNLNTHSADAFGGRDSFRHDFPPLLKAINYSMTSFLTTGGLRGKKGKKFAKFYPRSFNMGLSRELWQQIGGFGSLRHGQDIEFSNRILKSGAKVIFIDNAYVYHKRRTNIRRFYRQVYNWGVARINLYKIDPSMLEPLHTFPALVTLGLILVIILAVFFKLFQGILIFLLLVAFLMLIYSMIDALRIYRESKPAFLLPVILPAQVFGYGLGFINNFIRRVLLGKEAKVGFRRNYYK